MPARTTTSNSTRQRVRERRPLRRMRSPWHLVVLGLALVGAGCGAATPPLGEPVAAISPASVATSPASNDRDATSSRAVAQPATVLDVRYGTATGCPSGGDHRPCGGSQTFDVFPSPGSAGTIVFVHGGGFAGGDKSHREEIAPFLAQRTEGWDVVAVNYRLADVGTGTDLFPTAVHDLDAALRWVRGPGGALHGLDVGRVVLAGHSAGATIATLHATAANSGDPLFGPLQPVDGFVALAGIHDFSIGGPWGRNWFGDDPSAAPLAAVLASPLTWWDPSDPPGLLVHGDRDAMVAVDNSLRLAAAAAEAGAPERVRLQLVGDGAQASDRDHWPAGAIDHDELSAFLVAR